MLRPKGSNQIMATMSKSGEKVFLMKQKEPSGRWWKTKYAASSKDQRASRNQQQKVKLCSKKNLEKHSKRCEGGAGTKKSIEAMNSKPGEEIGDYDTGYYGDDDLSDGKRHYSYGRTNRARARRASGII